MKTFGPRFLSKGVPPDVTRDATDSEVQAAYDASRGRLTGQLFASLLYSQPPAGSCETCTATSRHCPSVFAKTKVKRANIVLSGPSLGFLVSAVCPYTIPVLPITRHSGLIGENVALSVLAKLASASGRSVAFPSTANS